MSALELAGTSRTRSAPALDLGRERRDASARPRDINDSRRNGPTWEPAWSDGPGMRETLSLVDRVADTDVTVLLTGETGVGKEVIARALHERSDRRHKPFVKVNCAALPAELLESELFGHERGAFTGAQEARIGRFEFANQGTLMLDEVGDLPLALQGKILNVLQDQECTRLGSNRVTPIDVRVLAATNRDLVQMIQDGTFREDLYHRLQVIDIRVPPLRERREEIPGLVECFLRRFSQKYDRPFLRLSAAALEVLCLHPWPGNVRQLENAINRFVVLRDERMLIEGLRASGRNVARPTAAGTTAALDGRAPDATPAEGETGAQGLTERARAAARATEHEVIRRALDQCRWNRRTTATRLGVSYKTLLAKMKVCGLSQ